jgi:transcriptional regulator with XRE-family HTH domain
VVPEAPRHDAPAADRGASVEGRCLRGSASANICQLRPVLSTAAVIQAAPAPRSSVRTAAGRRLRAMTRSVGLEIRRLREDVGLTQRQLALRAGLDHGFLARVETGERCPSFATLTAISMALGGDVRVHLYPGTGPVIRDGVHAAMATALLDIIDPRWHRFVEVPSIVLCAESSISCSTIRLPG